VLYNDDEFLNRLSRPLLAVDDDEDDELFNDDLDEDAPLDDKESDVDDDDDDSDRLQVAKGDSRAEAVTNTRNSSGITRNATGFGVLTVLGAVPLILLILYMLKGAGLSKTSLLFMVTFFVGMIMSVWTFTYYRGSGAANFSRFDVHSFFKW